MAKAKQSQMFAEHQQSEVDIFLENIDPLVINKNVIGKKFPAEYMPKPKKITAKSNSNDLTKTIVTYLQLNQIQCSRINTQGQFQQLGKTFVNGKETIYGMWAKSGSTKGVSDLICCINSKFVAIEIKVGSDKQNEEQKQWQTNHEKNGGIYIIAKDFDNTKLILDSLIFPK